MPINVLFVGTDSDWNEYETHLTAAFGTIAQKTELSRDHAPEQTDYIVMAGSNIIQDFTPYTRAKALLRLWAGVEDIVGNDTLKMPITRMVGGGLDEGMVEWVTAHTLRHHIGMDAHILRQDGIWRGGTVPPLARERKVTVLGLGALGAACATALASFGFRVTGWARSSKSIKGVTCVSGPVGDALHGADIVVALLPLTPDTTNILNADTLKRTARGAVVLNPGRGALIDDEALLAALDSGQIGQATLDTFRTEPLGASHAYWAHPNVTVTPHIASATRPDIAARVIAENIQRGETRLPLLHIVDRAAGY